MCYRTTRGHLFCLLVSHEKKTTRHVLGAVQVSSGNMVKAGASAASDRARSFVLAALHAFDRPGIDLDQVVKSARGKFLPLPAQTGASAPEKIASNAPKSGRSTRRGWTFTRKFTAALSN